MPYVIGIGGPSRSGKSRLAKQIIDHLSKRKGIHIDMDDYVLPVSKIPKIGNQTDWESSRSVDFKKLISAVRKGSNDYDLVIVEGILIFEDDELQKLLDKTIHINITKATFWDRRLKETRWGKEPAWYLEHVWTSYLEHYKKLKCDIDVDGTTPLSKKGLLEIVTKLNPRILH
ncbi:MAG: hypothetical protein HRT61_21190 [Ekhidna sp.]|nr:hypothetical protein [Ekhidna sp.]